MKVVYFYKKILEFISLTKSINKRFWKEDKTLVIQTYHTVLMKKNTYPPTSIMRVIVSSSPDRYDVWFQITRVTSLVPYIYWPHVQYLLHVVRKMYCLSLRVNLFIYQITKTVWYIKNKLKLRWIVNIFLSWFCWKGRKSCMRSISYFTFYSI